MPPALAHPSDRRSKVRPRPKNLRSQLEMQIYGSPQRAWDSNHLQSRRGFFGGHQPDSQWLSSCTDCDAVTRAANGADLTSLCQRTLLRLEVGLVWVTRIRVRGMVLLASRVRAPPSMNHPLKIPVNHPFRTRVVVVGWLVCLFSRAKYPRSVFVFALFVRHC